MNSFTDREVRLLPTLINVLVAGMCDPQRLSRGRTYSRQGAVMDLQVEAGSLTGLVQGSRPRPYFVTVRATSAEEFVNVTALVPNAREIDFDCTCPDWDSPCKHAVAVMSAFADRVSRDPGLLITWRGAAATSSGRATVGSRTNRGQAEPAPPNTAPAVTAAASEALRAFLGETFRFDQPTLTPLPPPVGLWEEPWATMLDDALKELRQTR